MPGGKQTLEAVAAYDHIAPAFRALSERRSAYLAAVDSLILDKIPKNARSLLDAGAGDGHRAIQLATAAGIPETVLVEPSAAMRALIPPGHETWETKIETLTPSDRKFDVILCLWNVLGHVPDNDLRVTALQNLACHCTSEGMIFLDVLNRYNVAECGWITVMGRRLRDAILPSERNGNVEVIWNADGRTVKTHGHVFTAKEADILFRRAGLSLVERIVLNYHTGKRNRQLSSGNPLYVLRPTSYSNQSLR